MRIIFIFLIILPIINLSGQVDTIKWISKASLPDSVQRVGFGYFLIDSDFYVVGGQAGFSTTCLSTVWKYHIPSDQWMQMQPLPFGPASSQCSFVLTGKGYFLAATDSANNNNCDTMFWEYYPSGDNWIRREGFPDAPRANSSAFTYSDKGYVCCTGACGIDDNHLWQYDPISNIWIQMTALPDAIASGRAVAIASPDAAYCIGGINGSFGYYINDLMRYNIINNSWDSIGQMPGAPRAYTIFWGFDSLLMGGGGENGITLFNDFYKYNISLNTWTPVMFQNSFDSTAGGATFVFDKRAYYFGGISTINPNTTFNNKMWSFDASKYIHDTTTGLVDIKNEIAFSVYPNPSSHEQAFSISTSESGSISFYDALGRVIDERKLVHGINQIKLTTDDEVIFYHATLQYGAVENGKVVFIK